MEDLDAARAGVECSHSLGRSLARRADAERRRRARLSARLLALPVAAIGVYLIGSQLFKIEELPSPALLSLGFLLLIPFLATFGD